MEHRKVGANIKVYLRSHYIQSEINKWTFSLPSFTIGFSPQVLSARLGAPETNNSHSSAVFELQIVL